MLERSSPQAVKRSVESIAAVSLAAVFSGVVSAGDPNTGDPSPYASYADRTNISLAGTFRAFDLSHPDFSGGASDGAGRYAGLLDGALDPDGRPTGSTSGYLVETFGLDADGFQFVPTPTMATLPTDSPANIRATEGGAATSASDWFNDTAALTSDKSSVMLQKWGASYVFEGYLDAGGNLESSSTPMGNKASTHEINTTFVYEQGLDWYVDAETDGEVWVFVDDQLVLDGGAARSEDEVIDFDIVDGDVIPTEQFAVRITSLGGSIFNGTYHRPITTKAVIGGSTYQPFGNYNTPVQSNLNDNQAATGWNNPNANPRSHVIPDTFDAGTVVDIFGRSFGKTSSSSSGLNNGHWTTHREYNSASGSAQIVVLRDGDPVPSYTGLYDQTTAADYVAEYIDASDDTMDLGVNQIIYLYELGTTYTSSSADFQDLVVLVTLASDPADFPAPVVAGEDTFTGIHTDMNVSVTQGTQILHGPGDNSIVSTNGTNSNAINVTKTDSLIDTDVRVGPGANVSMAVNTAQGGAISGTRGTLDQPIPMPMIFVPDVGPSTGPLTVSGTTTISSSGHYDSWSLGSGSVLTISGSVTIVVENGINLGQNSQVLLAPGASLEMYVKGNNSGQVLFENQSRFNIVSSSTSGDGSGAITTHTPGDASRASIYYMGIMPIIPENGAVVAAGFAAPYAEIDIENGSSVFGSFIGKKFKLSNSGAFTMTGGIIIPDPDGDGSSNGSGDTDTDTETLAGELPPGMRQRVSLDRFDWLNDGRTHTLRVFFANRFGEPTPLRFETNIATLNLAALPTHANIMTD